MYCKPGETKELRTENYNLNLEKLRNYRNRGLYFKPGESKKLGTEDCIANLEKLRN